MAERTMKEENSFMSNLMHGQAIIEDVDNYVSYWHENKIEQPLELFLGFTVYEYETWLKKGNSVIKDILYCRKHNIAFEQYENA